MIKKEKVARGQNLRTETAPDRSSYDDDNNEALMGRKMGGGPLDLSASLSGSKPEKTGEGNYDDAPMAKRK